MALQPSKFKLLNATVAKDLAKQIINRYLVLHGLPALGVGIVKPPTVKRIKNKAAQTVFRANHQRYSIWKASDNEDIVTAYEKKLQALRVSKKNYLNALRIWNKARYAYDNAVKRAAANPNSGSNLTDLQAIVNLRLQERDDKHAIYLAAQKLNYLGDGTAI